MQRRLVLSLLLAAIAVCGVVGSYLTFASLLKTVLIAAVISLFTGIFLYFVWKPKPDKSMTPDLGTTAITSIASLCSGPILSGLLKAYTSDLEKVGFPVQYLNSFAKEYGVITIVAIVAIVIVVWLRKDNTISGRQPGDVADDIGEIGFKQKLERIAQVLENRLSRIDDESNWTDEAFNPLDAEIEKQSNTGSRSRKLGDLINSIRGEHKAKGFLVLGDPGAGKSVAMRHLAREMLKEVPKTGILPIYVNLKEWTDSEKLISSPNDADIFAFISNYFKSGGIDLIVEFSDRYLSKLLEAGRLFIIFDSFDETPVLLDRDETSDVIKLFSTKIEEFMIGPHMSRCVIASRYYRRPSFYSTELVVLDILPLSRQKIRETLTKSNRLTPVEIDQFMSSQNQWINYVKNPFVANLVVSFISNNKGALPKSKVQVYEDYIKGRLDRLKQLLQDYKLTSTEVDSIATLIAYEMFSRSHVGLEAEIYELQTWIDGKYEVKNLRQAIDVLERARLVRRSPYPSEKISFVHRRFNEYFLAQAIVMGLTKIDLESITNDRRDRDALVLYVELASDEEAKEIVEFCWSNIAPQAATNIVSIVDAATLRATYCLRFLVDGYTSSKKQLIDCIAKELYEYLLICLKQHEENMLRAKIAMEAAAVLDDQMASEIITQALLTQNHWIMETAIRASRNITQITPSASSQIKKYILLMPEAKTIRSRGELGDLFKLNSTFSYVRMILNVKFFLIIFQWPVRIFALLFYSYLFAFVILSQLLFELLGFSNDRLRRLNFGFSNIENTFSLAAKFYFFIFAAQIIPHFLINIANGRSNFFEFETTQSFLTSPFYELLPRSAIYFMLSVSTIPFSVSLSQWFELFEFISKNMQDGFLIIIYKMRKPFQAVATVCATIFIFFAVVNFLATSTFVEGWGISNKELVKYFLEFAGIGLIIVISCLFIWVLFSPVYDVFYTIKVLLRDRKRLNTTPDSKFADRHEIEILFKQFETDFFRLRLVFRVEDYHRKNGTRPHGNWSTGAAPNRLDRASIRLSQLDESWCGLER